MIKSFLLSCGFAVLCLLLCQQLIAQKILINGKVLAVDDGQPLAGVSVHVKGTTEGAQTNASGVFTVRGDLGNVLVFSSIGYIQFEYRVRGPEPVTIRLEAASKTINELVVVGYGVKPIKEIVGSVSKIRGSDVASIPLPSFDQALSGKTAGVQIASSGGLLGDGISIRIRGINSISGSSLPLVVIDGIPTSNVENANSFNSGNGTRFNPLASLNENDIESIDILKDAGASAIYGSRASNGVVLITTKHGRAGQAKVTVDSRFSWQQAERLLPLLNGDQFITIQNEKALNRFGPTDPNSVIAKNSFTLDPNKPDRTDWNKELYHKGFGYDNNLSVSGGSEKASFFGSVRYFDQKGIVLGNRLKSGQARINVDVHPKNWFKANLSLAYSKLFNQGVLSDRYLSGFAVAGENAFPNVASLNPSGGYRLDSRGYLDLGANLGSLSSGTPTVQSNINHPTAVIALNRNNNTLQNISGNVSAEVMPLNGLRISSRFGIDDIENFEDQYSSPLLSGLGKSFNGIVQDNYRNRNLWNWSTYASYDHLFSQRHKISLLAGNEYQYTEEQSTYAGASDFTDPFFKDIIFGAYTGNDNNGTLQLWSGGDRFSNGLVSYFGRATYSFDEKYFLDLSFRRDGFSAFGKNNRFGNFPGISAGWIISRESFLSDSKFINFLKLRGSYGIVGNSRGIGDYASRFLYKGSLYASLGGFSGSQAGNPNLKWETGKKFDVGFDLILLSNKLSLTADFFQNNISQLLLNAPVLYTVGVPSPNIVGVPNSTVAKNIGSMYNRGIELTLNDQVVKSGHFSWNSSINFTAIKNRVTATADGSPITDPNFLQASATVGKPLGVYRLIRWAGVDPQTGNPSFLSADGTRKFYDPSKPSSRWTTADGKATTAISGSDAVYQGNKTGVPSMYGGWNNTFQYHGIELSFSLVYTGGFYIYNSTRSNLLSNYLNNNITEILGRWTSPGQNAAVPKLYLLDNTANQTSTRFLEKGDFLRLRTVNLGYSLPSSWLKQSGLESVKIYAQVYNAFLITGYKGADPEVNYNRNNTNIAVALDSRSVPQPRIYALGINITL